MPQPRFNRIMARKALAAVVWRLADPTLPKPIAFSLAKGHFADFAEAVEPLSPKFLGLIAATNAALKAGDKGEVLAGCDIISKAMPLYTYGEITAGTQIHIVGGGFAHKRKDGLQLDCTGEILPHPAGDTPVHPV